MYLCMGDRVVKVVGLRSTGAIRMGSIPIPYNLLLLLKVINIIFFDDIYYKKYK